MEKEREFFEVQIAQMMEQYHTALKRVKKSIEAFNQVRNDTEVVQGAYSVISRGWENPYIKPVLATVELVTLGDQPDAFPMVKAKRATRTPSKILSDAGVRKGKALDFSMDTKAGILRNTIHKLDRGATIDEIEEALPEITDPELHISKGDLYRMLPRFVTRGELRKRGRIYLRPDMADPTDDALIDSLFSEEVSED